LMGCIGNLAVGVAQPLMGRANDQITFAAIPSEIQGRILVVKPGEENGEKVIDQDKVKALPPEQQTVVLDAQKDGAKWSFRYVSALPVLLVLIFGAIALSDRARGGYKPEVLSGSGLTPAELASDY
jgi:hypothetical protein